MLAAVSAATFFLIATGEVEGDEERHSAGADPSTPAEVPARDCSPRTCERRALEPVKGRSLRNEATVLPLPVLTASREAVNKGGGWKRKGEDTLAAGPVGDVRTSLCLLLVRLIDSGSPLELAGGTGTLWLLPSRPEEDKGRRRSKTSKALCPPGPPPFLAVRPSGGGGITELVVPGRLPLSRDISGRSSIELRRRKCRADCKSPVPAAPVAGRETPPVVALPAALLKPYPWLLSGRREAAREGDGGKSEPEAVPGLLKDPSGGSSGLSAVGGRP